MGGFGFDSSTSEGGEKSSNSDTLHRSSWDSGLAPGGLQAAGVSQDSPRAKTSTFEVPTDQNTTKIPREDPQREEKFHEKTPGERKKDSWKEISAESDAMGTTAKEKKNT